MTSDDQKCTIVTIFVILITEVPECTLASAGRAFGQTSRPGKADLDVSYALG